MTLAADRPGRRLLRATTSATSTSTSSSAPGATSPATARRTSGSSSTARSTSARFDPDGTGEWLPLVHGQGGLDAAAGFPGQAEVLVNARGAADVRRRDQDGPARSGSRCIRRAGEVYCTLTNNSRRGAPTKGPATDPANPRAEQRVRPHHPLDGARRRRGGHPLRLGRLRPRAATRPAPTRPSAGRSRATSSARRTACGSTPAGSSGSRPTCRPASCNKGDYAAIGNNQMLAADPATRRGAPLPHRPARAARSPAWSATPDGRTLFVNIQHPGETSSERGDPANPTAVSAWPDGAGGGRPSLRRRSSSGAVDGGVIGA